jgi:hypothetical protein
MALQATRSITPTRKNGGVILLDDDPIKPGSTDNPGKDAFAVLPFLCKDIRTVPPEYHHLL